MPTESDSHAILRYLAEPWGHEKQAASAEAALRLANAQAGPGCSKAFKGLRKSGYAQRVKAALHSGRMKIAAAGSTIAA